MCSQCKMLVFLSDFLGGKIFHEVSADLQANRPEFHGNCVFYLK